MTASRRARIARRRFEADYSVSPICASRRARAEHVTVVAHLGLLALGISF